MTEFFTGLIKWNISTSIKQEKDIVKVINSITDLFHRLHDINQEEYKEIMAVWHDMPKLLYISGCLSYEIKRDIDHLYGVSDNLEYIRYINCRLPIWRKFVCSIFPEEEMLIISDLMTFIYHRVKKIESEEVISNDVGPPFGH